jgi:hypothetical protein
MSAYSVSSPKPGHKWSTKEWQAWAKGSGAYLEGDLETCAKCAAPPQFVVFLEPKDDLQRTLFLCRGHFETTYPMQSTIYSDYNRAGFRELVV